MSDKQGNRADDMEEEYEIEGADNLDEADLNNRMQDTTAAQVRNGRDIQGIPWERLKIMREVFRQHRIWSYENYENVLQSGERAEMVACKTTKKGGPYYDFIRYSRSVESTILHFQLRNLVWATSKHDVYFVSHFSVMHWSSLTLTKSEVLNVSGHVAPTEKHPGNVLEGFTRTQHLDRPGVSYCTRTTQDDNAITNAVEIYTSGSGALHFIASSNDCRVRDFDMETFQLSKDFPFSWPVNHTSLSPDKKLLLVVGDDPNGLLVDFSTGVATTLLRGQLDYCFASAWHPNGLTFATGSQDKICRVWDIRNLSRSITALRGNLGAIHSIRYTSDGKFMAMAEVEDFVHIFDVGIGYGKEQEIDFVGEISGISFSPDADSLFVGVCHENYGGLMEFGRHREYTYLDSII
ncbi:hypothetical protein BUALT_Bualt18G0079800 [Buddleja alternifolia]|uniref:Uncharacterized protein n=1 Tax=Buddleja alternifolia TaxID=168488 RepID=A0AAV6W9J0_9LAMI|nr:hypothetical protein BUALT_Bualt18G0079800 [Buddleja alternifolia]